MSDTLKYWLLGLIIVGALLLTWLGLRMARTTASAVAARRVQRSAVVATNPPSATKSDR